MSNPSSTHLSRRRFLGLSAAAAVAAPWIVPSSVLGGAGNTPPSERITVAGIGMGGQGRRVFSAVARSPNVQAVAVCDVFKDQRERAASQHNCRAYTDYRELLARGDIDAVMIATPDHWHGPMVVAAARAGCDIYCEKPLSLTIHEARQMVRAVRRHHRVFQTGSQQRSAANFRRACELVRSGYIGQVKEVWAAVGGPSRPCHHLPAEPVPEGLDYELWLGPAPFEPYHRERISGEIGGRSGWRAWFDYSGGMMTDWGAHNFDIAQWGLGMDDSGPVEVLPPVEGRSAAEGRPLTFRYANGIPLYRGNGPFRGAVQFIGSEGRIGVSRGRLWSDPEALLQIRLRPDDVHLEDSRHHVHNFIECIRTRRKPICDVEIGCHSVNVCHVGNIALWLNRPLRWDPAAEQFIDDADANRWLRRAMREPYGL